MLLIKMEFVGGLLVELLCCCKNSNCPVETTGNQQDHNDNATSMLGILSLWKIHTQNMNKSTTEPFTQLNTLTFFIESSYF